MTLHRFCGPWCLSLKSACISTPIKVALLIERFPKNRGKKIAQIPGEFRLITFTKVDNVISIMDDMYTYHPVAKIIDISFPTGPWLATFYVAVLNHSISLCCPAASSSSMPGCLGRADLIRYSCTKANRSPFQI